MALPPLENLSSLEILNLIYHPEIGEEIIRANRILEGIPPDAKETTLEHIWKMFLAARREGLQVVLKESDPYELFSIWQKHKGRKRRRGNSQLTSYLYDLSATHMATTDKSLMEVFRDMVLPVLIINKTISTDEMGNPDSNQV